MKMKRSEMIKKIIDSICWEDFEIHEFGGTDKLNLVEAILNTAESWGMLPPRAKIPVTIRGIETPMYDNCWEKE